MARINACGCALCLVLPYAVGCSIGSPGELGKGGFTTNCTSEDSSCSYSFTGQALPSYVAVGSSLAVDYSGQMASAASAGARVVPASTLFARAASDGVHFLAPGTVALLARSSSVVVDDFVHVQVQPIDDLKIDGPSSLYLTEDGKYSVTAYSVDHNALAGSLPFVWSTSTPELVSMTGSFSDTARVTLHPEKAGRGALRVQVGGTLSDLNITVREKP